MKTKNIKKYAITAAVIVAVCAVFALLFFGMSKLLNFDRGQVVAEYDGNLVYEADVQDIINYQLIVQVNDQTTNNQLNAIMINAVKTYVQYLVMEQDLAAKGYTIDEEAFEKTLKETKAQIEETHGYKEWCEMYRVSKDFLEEELRRYEIASLYSSVMQSDIKVTEKEARDYYQVHAISDYALPAGYYWTSVLRPVRDITNETEAAEAKAEMDAYLEKIMNGSMTLEKVNEELDKKYNLETAYLNSIYDGEDTIATEYMYSFIDENDYLDLLNTIDETYKNRDPKADKSSEAYADYMNYLASTFEAKVHYALQNLEPGEIYTETLQSYVGTYIIRLDRIETQNAFVPYDQVSVEILELLMAQKLEEDFSDYLNSLDETYDIVYYVG